MDVEGLKVGLIGCLQACNSTWTHRDIRLASKGLVPMPEEWVSSAVPRLLTGLLGGGVSGMGQH